MENELLNVSGALSNYSYLEMIANILLATVLGFIISAVYRGTHKGLSYSQSFTHTVLFVTVIVAIVMMVIGGSLSRAFALVGALSIIRFRTVIKDTKDTAFVFVGLAVGMAAGTSNYFLAIFATGFVSLLAIVVHKLNYGALYKSEFILRFMFEQGFESSGYLELIDAHSKNSNLLHIEPSGDGNFLRLTYDVTLKEDFSADQFIKEIALVEGLSEAVLIASKNDIDY